MFPPEELSWCTDLCPLPMLLRVRTRMHGAWPLVQAAGEAAPEMKAPEEKGEGEEEWEEFTDPGTGRKYYLNKATGKTQWDQPTAIIDAWTKAMASGEMADVRKLSPQEIEDARKVFTRFDADNSNSIDKDELAAASAALPPRGRCPCWPGTSFLPLMQSDVLSACSRQREWNTAHVCVAPCAHPRQVMSSMGAYPTADELQAMIDAADTDGNGTVEFEEFLAILSMMPKDEDWEEFEDEATGKPYFRSARGCVCGFRGFIECLSLRRDALVSQREVVVGLGPSRDPLVGRGRQAFSGSLSCCPHTHPPCPGIKLLVKWSGSGRKQTRKRQRN